MSAVSVRIFHTPAQPGASPLEALVAEARGRLAEVHRKRFIAAHVLSAAIVTDPALRSREASLPGTLVLESAALPLAMAQDYARLRAAASIGQPPMVELATDDDAWRHDIRIDSPLDLLLAARDGRLPEPLRRLVKERLDGEDLGPLRAAFAAVSGVLVDRRAQVLILGRDRPSTPPWPPEAVRCLVLWESDPRHVMDMDRPEAIASALAPQADAAIVDSRLLLATRLLRRRRTWPPLGDRFASDLLLAETVEDPWLRALTQSVAERGLPILLGGPSLIGWGIRMLLTGRRRNPARP